MSNQYILFTWNRCSQCSVLKNDIQHHIQNGIVKEYDLDKIPKDSNLMSLFNHVSPYRSVPALAIFSNGKYHSARVGVQPIKSILKQ